ncbi:MAG: cadherin-like domain-containing protein, partial [Pseudomonadota bacterium]
GDDTVDGGVGNDLITGANGADSLTGGDGDDTIFAGINDDASDTLSGGAGNDSLFGFSGADLIEGGDGDDKLDGNGLASQPDGDDTLRGDGGSDILFGGRGDDLVEGGTGDDELSGNQDDDTLNGGDGMDSIFAQFGDDLADGGAGDDLIFGGQDDGDDTLIGGAGTDTLFGGQGADVFVYRTGDGADDIRDFGLGADVLNLSGLTGVSNFGDILARASDGGLGVTLDFSDLNGGDQILLRGVTTADLAASDFSFEGTGNTAPNAANDAVGPTAQDTPLPIDDAALLANDMDVDLDTLEIVSVQNAVNGTVALQMDGDILFTPAAGFTGAASFTYTVSDGNGGESSALVEITVEPAVSNNLPPIATDDTRTIGEADSSNSFNQSSGFSVLNNDSDPEGDDLTIVGFDDTGTLGNVVLVGQDLRYDDAGAFDALNDGETAQDTFTYTIEDEAGNQSTATVTVTIEGSTANGGGDPGGGDPGGGTLRILPLGDSITLGISESNNGQGQGSDLNGYRLPLFNELTNAGADFDFVGQQSNGTNALPDQDHQGISGFRASQLAGSGGNSASSVVNATDPDVVLLMIGVNDIDNDNDGNASNNVANDISSIIDDIHAIDPDIEIFVSEILPVRAGLTNASGFDMNTIIDTTNAQIQSVIAGKSGNVQFVSMDGFTSANISAPADDNGLHPTSGGFDIIADNWFDAIDGEINLSAPAMVASATLAPGADTPAPDPFLDDYGLI